MTTQTAHTRLKNNVDKFSQDVAGNSGYAYTTNKKFSSTVANQRLTEATLHRLAKDIKTVLDVGCGDGTYTDALQVARPDIVFCGFDASETAVMRASKLYPNIRFWADNVLQPLATSGAHFDVAIIRGLLHHTADPALAIANMAQLAKSLIIIEPNGNNPVLKGIEKLSSYHRGHEERSFLPWRLMRWCRQAGCKIDSLDYAGFVPFFCPDNFARAMHVAQPYLERVPVVRQVFSAVSIIKCSRPET